MIIVVDKNGRPIPADSISFPQSETMDLGEGRIGIAMASALKAATATATRSIAATSWPTLTRQFTAVHGFTGTQPVPITRRVTPGITKLDHVTRKQPATALHTPPTPDEVTATDWVTRDVTGASQYITVSEVSKQTFTCVFTATNRSQLATCEYTRIVTA